MICRFSSSLMPSTRFTCRSQVFPKIETAGVSASINARTFASCSTAFLANRVAPNAHSLACPSFKSFARSKNSLSFGFDIGQPPSM